MREAKLFSGAIFLFLVFLTAGFFQLFKPQSNAPIQVGNSVAINAVPHDILPDDTREEVRITSSSLHEANSIEFSRHTLYLFEVLFQREPALALYDMLSVRQRFNFLNLLFKTLISPNAP